MARFLGRCPAPLADIAYTLQTGREPLRERLALVVASTAELAERLRQFAAGGGTDGIHGRAPVTEDVTGVSRVAGDPAALRRCPRAQPTLTASPRWPGTGWTAPRSIR